ncbi:MAG: hypothetical protein ACXQS3_04515 [Candidatus Methanofastidiosia archaeon]
MVISLYEYNNILKYLSDIEDIEVHLNKNDMSLHEELKGYTFFIQSCLDKMHETISLFPASFGLVPDEAQYMAYQMSISKVERPNMDELGKVLYNIAFSIKKLNRVQNVGELKKILGTIEKYIINPLNEAYLEVNHKYIIDTYKEDPNQLLDKLSLGLLYCCFHDIKFIKIYYNTIIKKEKEPLPQFCKIRENLGKHHLFESYKTFSLYLWEKMLKKDFTKYRKHLYEINYSDNWKGFDNYFEYIREYVSRPLINNGGMIIEDLDIVDMELELDYCPISEIPIFPNEMTINYPKLPYMLYYYPVKIICSDYSAANQKLFEHIIKGQLEDNNHVDVLKFIHTSNNVITYSFAILIRAQVNSISEPLWQVFLNFADNGYYSLDKDIMTLLSNDNVKIREYSLPYDELEEHCQSTQINNYESVIEDYGKKISGYKGYMLELLVAHIYSNKGYKTRTDIRGKIIDDKQIDVLAHRCENGKCIINIIEVTTTKEDFINELEEKMAIFNKNMGNLLRKLDIPLDNEIIIYGVGISLKGHNNIVSNSITTYDKDGLENMMKENNIPLTYLEFINARTKKEEIDFFNYFMRREETTIEKIEEDTDENNKIRKKEKNKKKQLK